jgi:Rieske Fe-S protein
MQYAASLPALPSRRTMIAPVVALLVGAGAATGVYALIDNSDGSAQAARVIVVERPAPAVQIPGKDGPTLLEPRGSKASASSASDSTGGSAPSGPPLSVHAR